MFRTRIFWKFKTEPTTALERQTKSKSAHQITFRGEARRLNLTLGVDGRLDLRQLLLTLTASASQK
jgi:hypothetical protein